MSETIQWTLLIVGIALFIIPEAVSSALGVTMSAVALKTIGASAVAGALGVDWSGDK